MHETMAERGLSTDQMLAEARKGIPHSPLQNAGQLAGTGRISPQVSKPPSELGSTKGAAELRMERANSVGSGGQRSVPMSAASHRSNASNRSRGSHASRGSAAQRMDAFIDR